MVVRRKTTDEDVELAQAMRAAGTPLAEVASVLGVSAAWVSIACRPTRAGPAWAPVEQVERVRELIASGMTVRAVAEELGMSPSAVQRAKASPRA